MIYPTTFETKIDFTAVRAAVSSRCVTDEGRTLCADMAFTGDAGEVERRLMITAEMLTVVSGDEDIAIGRVRSVGAAVRAIRVPGSYLSTAELSDLRQSLEAIGEIMAFFKTRRDDHGRSTLPLLDALAADLLTFPECLSVINTALDRYGNIKDNASPELHDLRRQLSSLQSSLGTRMRRVVQQAIQAGYLEGDATPSVRDGRLVLPVPPMYKRKISGIVHDESASGKTVYIEPAEIVEINNRLRELQMEERREITRILISISDTLRAHLDEILGCLDTLGEIDFIHAKALYARLIDAKMPTLHREPGIEWYHAVHPVLLAALERQGKEVVPLDITLTAPEARILVISGPNAGGKSVCIKTVAIVQYMLQCGLLPPLYENSHCGVFSDIMLDIGDDQSLEDDLSTYSSHLRNMKFMLQHGRDTSLLIIDEFGSGTEPQIGGAIAQSLLAAFNRRKMWGVVTSHYQNIKTFAEDTPGIVNGSMLYDRHLMKPMFRLSIGNPGSSFAVEIARKTGLPEEIIRGAEEIVGSDYINLDKYLLDIARDKRYWENKRQQIRIKEKKIDDAVARHEAMAEELRAKRSEIISDARREAERILQGSNAAIERTIHDIRTSQAEREKTLAARRKLDEEKAALITDTPDNHPLLKTKKRKTETGNRKPETGNRKPQLLTVGSTVKLEGQDTPGRIISIDSGKATVAFGVLKTTVALSRLRPSTAKIDTGARSTTVTTSTDHLHDFKQEIDVRGMRADEAVQAVTYFIDDAIRFRAGRVRILHGTGTGALRQYIRRYLSTLGGVASYRDEDVRFGGAGITVVDLA